MRRGRQQGPLREPPSPQKAYALSHLERNGTTSRHHSFADVASQLQSAYPSGSMVISSTTMSPAVVASPKSSAAHAKRSSPLFAPLIPLHIARETLSMPLIPQSPLSSYDATPMPLHSHAQTVDSSQPPSSPLTTTRDPDYFSVRARQSSTGSTIPDDFTVYLKQDSTAPPTPLGSGSGLMGRLKNFGKVGGKKGPGDVGSLSPVVEPILTSDIKHKVSLLPCFETNIY